MSGPVHRLVRAQLVSGLVHRLVRAQLQCLAWYTDWWWHSYSVWPGTQTGDGTASVWPGTQTGDGTATMQSFIYRNTRCTKSSTKMWQAHKITRCRKITQIDWVQNWKSTNCTSFFGKTFLKLWKLAASFKLHYTVYSRSLILPWKHATNVWMQ